MSSQVPENVYQICFNNHVECILWTDIWRWKPETISHKYCKNIHNLHPFKKTVGGSTWLSPQTQWCAVFYRYIDRLYFAFIFCLNSQSSNIVLTTRDRQHERHFTRITTAKGLWGVFCSNTTGFTLLPLAVLKYSTRTSGLGKALWRSAFQVFNTLVLHSLH